MKRISMILLLLVLCFIISGCGGNNARGNSGNDTLAASPEAGTVNGSENPAGNAGDDGADTREGAVDSGQAETPLENEDAGASAKSSILVAYFSLADEQYEVGVIEKGNTQIIAEMIAEQTDADTFSIERVVAYPTTYDGLLEISREEESNPPEIAGTVENMDDYTVIFIGYPIWWGDLPTIVKIFLESYDFSGKTVIPFCTHAGSGLSGTQGTVEKLCEGAIVEDGLAVRGRTAQNERDSAESAVTDWLRGLGYIE